MQFLIDKKHQNFLKHHWIKKLENSQAAKDLKNGRSDHHCSDSETAEQAGKSEMAEGCSAHQKTEIDVAMQLHTSSTS